MKQSKLFKKTTKRSLSVILAATIGLTGMPSSFTGTNKTIHAQCQNGISTDSFSEVDYYRDYSITPELSLVSFLNRTTCNPETKVNEYQGSRLFFSYDQLEALNNWRYSPIINFKNISIDSDVENTNFYKTAALSELVTDENGECEFTYNQGGVPIKYSILKIRLRQGTEECKELCDGKYPIGNYSMYVAVNIHLDSKLSSVSNLVLPEKIATTIHGQQYDVPCVEIADYGFYNQSNLKTITIPDTYMRICEQAFAHCQNLTSFTFSNGFDTTSKYTQDGSSVHLIGAKAFLGCKKLFSANNGICNLPNTWVETPQTTSAKNLLSLRSSSTVSDYFMGVGVFADCDSIQTVSISGVNPSIPEWTFHDCDNLADIDFETENAKQNKTMKSIIFGSGCFQGNSYFGNKLKHVTVPCDASFASLSFADCPNLETFELQGTIDTTIGLEDAVSYNCRNIIFPYSHLENVHGYDYVFHNSFSKDANATFILNPHKLDSKADTTQEISSSKKINIEIPDNFFAQKNTENDENGLTNFIVGSKTTSDPDINLTVRPDAFFFTSVETLTFNCGDVTLNPYSLGGTFSLKDLSFENAGKLTILGSFLTTDLNSFEPLTNLKSIRFANQTGIVNLEYTCFAPAKCAKIIFDEPITKIEGTACTTYDHTAFSSNSSIYLLNPQISFLEYTDNKETTSNIFSSVKDSLTPVYGIPANIKDSNKHNDFWSMQQQNPNLYLDYYNKDTYEIKTSSILATQAFTPNLEVTVHDIYGKLHTIPAAKKQDLPIDGYGITEGLSKLETAMTNNATTSTTVPLTVSIYGENTLTTSVEVLPQKVVSDSVSENDTENTPSSSQGNTFLKPDTTSSPITSTNSSISNKNNTTSDPSSTSKATAKPKSTSSTTKTPTSSSSQNNTTLSNSPLPNAIPAYNPNQATDNINQTKVKMGVKEKLVITLSYSKVKTYSIVDNSIATISNTGTVTALKKGTTIITLIDTNNKKYTFLLIVKKAPKKIKASLKEHTLKTGKKLILKKGKKATVKLTYPKGGYSHTLSFHSNHPKIATVNNGVITAKKKGSAKITVKTYNNKTATIKVKIK